VRKTGGWRLKLDVGATTETKRARPASSPAPQISHRNFNIRQLVSPPTVFAVFNQLARILHVIFHLSSIGTPGIWFGFVEETQSEKMNVSQVEQHFAARRNPPRLVQIRAAAIHVTITAFQPRPAEQQRRYELYHRTSTKERLCFRKISLSGVCPAHAFSLSSPELTRTGRLVRRSVAQLPK
jgi:hypothetical protein